MKDRIISSVKETTDYSKFKLLNENRLITTKALAKIEKSVAKDGWRNYPITVNEKMEIIEGQHTYMYAKENNLPLRYYIQEGATQKDCQIINSARTGWTMKDYIHSFAASGNTSYKYIEILVDRYSPLIPISSVFNMVFHDHHTIFIRNGELKLPVEKYNEAVSVLTYMEKLAPFINAIGGRKAVTYDALYFVYSLPQIDNERLFQVIKKYCHVMTPSLTKETALSEIEKVYNRNLPQDKRIYLVTEYKKSKGGRHENT